MINTKLKALRGDSVLILIEAELKAEATYRCQLRKTPEADEFLVMAIVENNILLTAAQSETLAENTYLVELEENDGGVVSTVQRTVLFVKNDVTRTYGTEAPAWTTDQSVEVAEMISRNMLIRKLDNSLVNVETVVAETEAATAEAIAATAEMIQDTSDAITVVDNAETLRAAKEAQRVIVESLRVSTEAARVTKEETRVTAETARVAAETARQTNSATAITAVNLAKTNAEAATVETIAATAAANSALATVLHPFESYANLPAGVETLIAGTSFTPVLNLRPVVVDVVHDGTWHKNVAARYVVNGDNYDIYLTSDVDLFGSEIVVQGALLSPSYYVRPLGTVYGSGDGTSYSNAWSGFGAIDWTKANTRGKLYICETHAEQLTIGAPGPINSVFEIRGDYNQADLSLINIEGTAHTHCILNDSKNNIKIKGFNLIGSGNGGAFRGQGSAGAGNPLIVENVNVLRNYAFANGDGFSLDNTAEFDFYNVSAKGCREEIQGIGSHQCITTHGNSKARVFVGTFSDSNNWAVNTLNSQISLDGITASSAMIRGLECGGDSTEIGFIKCTNSTLNFNVGKGTFSIPNTANPLTNLIVDNCIINATSSSLSNVFGKCTIKNSTLNIDDLGWSMYCNEGALTLENNILNISNTSTYAFRIEAGSGAIVAHSNTFNVVGCKYLFTYSGTSAPLRSMLYNNLFLNPKASSLKLIWIRDNGFAPLISNNVFYNATSGGVVVDLDHTGDEVEAARMIMQNNIFYNAADSLQPGVGALYTESNNCNYLSENLGGVGDITTDPLFVDAGTDFHLQLASLCKDAGIDLSEHYTTDKDGSARETWDIGAYAV